MRLIDADALKPSYVVTSTTTNSLCHLYVSIEDINSAPTIDAVDVVRCKDCRWAEPNEFKDFDCRCHIPTFRVNADDFCSRGERKESE